MTIAFLGHLGVAASFASLSCVAAGCRTWSVVMLPSSMAQRLMLQCLVRGSLSNMVSRHVSFVHDTPTHASVSRDSHSFQCFILGNGFSHWSVHCPLCGWYFVRHTVVAGLLVYATYCFWSHELFEFGSREQKVTSSGSVPLILHRAALTR